MATASRSANPAVVPLPRSAPAARESGAGRATPARRPGRHPGGRGGAGHRPSTLSARDRRRRRAYPLALGLLGVVALLWGPWRDGEADAGPRVVPEGATQNGWQAIEDRLDPRLVPFPWVTGKVLDGDVYAVLSYVAERFHAEVEPIDPASSWGWDYRAVRGEEGVLSNHASGTAIDLNAPDHPLGESGTFTGEQVDRLRAILDAVAPVVVWGGEFDRPDEMHLEVVGTPEEVAAVAARLAGG
jgi:hypothetical protein